MTDDRKYIYVKGKKIYVPDELYKAYKKELNHEAHLNRMDRKHRESMALRTIRWI